ncbi:dihydroxyacetone kinase family protein [Sciscionella sediminilitoris]|uniref:dihydroxyacetone kinase family protein n=1 Tax=Sciscionella sediminilitoris TaxID=1445613 RepID=UPI0004DEFB33|nr:dihydroxyacetone kinase family protein [Sciscionella sp. SE31]
MTRLYDDPARFAEDMVRGFAEANAKYVRQVPGGVVRAQPGADGKVAVITGGGSGHYPAFCGVVGPGFADGSVIGNIFTSPSAEQAYSVALEAECGGGVLFAFGNYAGDNMNFGLAVQRLEAEGIPAANIVITDDIASAPAAEHGKRRGIAGGFTVFKLASGAAEAGYSFEEVRRVAETTNARTRSLGVAFDGCTMPGQQEPLFTVPDGKMGVGLGIHGEPGISETELPSAGELAQRLVDGVLAEAPQGAGNRVAVLLNGLGRTKYEELFVLWSRMTTLFADAGLELVEPEVGELVTSLDMAGCSLTVTWLDEELERFWSAGVDTPAYRKGVAVAASSGTHTHRHAAARKTELAVAPEAGQRCARTVAAALGALSAAIEQASEELGRLDAIAGDGDHGRGMSKGATAADQAARRTAQAHAGPADVLAAAGDAWAADAGGTSGVLWGAALRAFGTALPADRAASTADVAAGAEKALETLVSLGKAELGDKTMLDAVDPFVTALREASGDDPATAWRKAARAATEAGAATASLSPKVGRARPLAERSVGTPDPGAVSFGIAVTAIAEVLEEKA